MVCRTEIERLIESILIELPIPQIFVIENSDGVYELIDGLQRTSSVLQFLDPTMIVREPFTLEGCDIIPDLNGKTYSDLPLSLKLRLKRSTLRTIVIKRQSKSFLRYEMFKRLNTGGSLLSPQEIRNCTARMLGEDGANFYSFLKDLADSPDFQKTTATLAQEDFEQKADEELVLFGSSLQKMSAAHLRVVCVTGWMILWRQSCSKQPPLI